MAGKHFLLLARVSSNSPDAIGKAMGGILPKGSFHREGNDFVAKADMEGDDPKELNRALLSSLRRVEKRTRLRSEWTSDDGTTYRFFDYVLKKASRQG
jgi:hypothetical protein